MTEAGTLEAPADFLFVPVVVCESGQLRPPLTTHMVCFLPWNIILDPLS